MSRSNASMKDRQLENLVRILRLAYSGELAAAYAYRGHWHSVSDELTKARIREIEDEERHHRRLVGDILAQLGRKPSRIREAKAFLIGRTLGALCHVTGWLAPMYGAGKLERRNIKEYEVAARFAAGAGRAEFIDCLLKMAEVEWEHEQYFRACVLSHRWSARIKLWPPPPAKEEIRHSFRRDVPASEIKDHPSVLDYEQTVA